MTCTIRLLLGCMNRIRDKASAISPSREPLNRDAGEEDSAVPELPFPPELLVELVIAAAVGRGGGRVNHEPPWFMTPWGRRRNRLKKLLPGTAAGLAGGSSSP